jgi:FSR family fosmidomycin resistance protein-like MFS transporter
LPTDSKLRDVFHRWGGSTALFFTYTHLSHDLCNGLLPALLPLIKESLGLSYLQSGFVLSALNVTTGLSQFPGGWLGDRVKRAAVMATGLGGVGLAAIAVGLSPHYYPMLAILIVMGIFAGAYHPAAASTISSYYEVDRRGKAIAIHMTGGSLGYSIGPILGGLIAEFTDWRIAFIVLSLPALIAVPLVLKKFGNMPLEKKSDSSESRTTKSDSILHVIRTVAVIFTLAVLTQLVGGSVMSFVPVYLVDKHGITPVYAAMLVGIFRAGGIAGSLLGGWLSDRWTRTGAIFLTFIATGPVLYLFTILPFSIGLVFVFILFSLLLYMRQSTVQPYLLEKVPPYLRATIFGIYFGLGMEGISILQPIFGHFMDLYGIVRVFDVAAIISIGLSAVSLLLTRKAKN